MNASSNVQAKIGNNYYETLEEAINAAGPNDTILLTSNVSLDKTLEINKTVNIDLNNNNIKADERVFLVSGGSLNLKGNGMVYEVKPNYGAIMLVGSDDPSKKDYSTVSIDSGILLEGWSGIFINHNNNTGYGILVNMNGKINSVADASGGTGAGIYVNGNIKNEDNHPIVNLSDTVTINSAGAGIYAAGFATYNINGAYISGKEAGLGIKSGIFNITSGNIIGSGPDKTPTSGNNNGINASGAAIQIESNKGYKGDIELYIKGGTIRSKNSNVIYEYTVGNTPTSVKNISISGGKLISDANKDVFLLSNSFKNTHNNFISGGTYSSNPTSYLKNGYTSSLNGNDLYEVVDTTSVFNEFNNNSSNFIIFIVVFSLITGIIIYYLNRKKVI